MTKIIVDQLEAFIKTQSMEGPFASADNFFGAMLDFLNDEEAKEVIRTAWMKQALKDVSDDPEDFIPAEEVFARLRERTDQAIRRSVTRDGTGIKSDRQAIQLMLARIDHARGCVSGVGFDVFENTWYMVSTVERSVEVVSTLLRTLTSAAKQALSEKDIEAVRDLARNQSFLAEPVPLKDYWTIATETFPRLETALESIKSTKA